MATSSPTLSLAQDQTVDLITFNADAYLGALLVGTIISSLLFGVFTMQVYWYFRTYPDDPRVLRIMVAFLWCIELALTTCAAAGIYYGSITLYGHPEKLDKLPKPILVTSAFSGPVTTTAQIFYALRTRPILRSFKRTIPVVLSTISVLRCIASYTIIVGAIRNPDVTEFTDKWAPVLATVFATGAAIDVVIVCVSVWGMLRERARGRESSLDKTVWILDRLIWWTIQTGLLTSVIHVAIVIVFLTMHTENLAWLSVYICLSKAYSHTLLAGLNFRRDLRRTFDRPEIIEMTPRTNSTRSNSRFGSWLNDLGLSFSSSTRTAHTGDLNSKVDTTPSDRRNGTASIDRVVISVNKDTLVTRDGDSVVEGIVSRDSKDETVNGSRLPLPFNK